MNPPKNVKIYLQTETPVKVTKHYYLVFNRITKG